MRGKRYRTEVWKIVGESITFPHFVAPGDKETIVRAIAAFEAECVDQLTDAKVIPLFTVEYSHPAVAYAAALDTLAAPYVAVHAYRSELVDDLVDDAKHRMRKHGFSATSLAQRLDVADSSAAVVVRDDSTVPTPAELLEAARRL